MTAEIERLEMMENAYSERGENALCMMAWTEFADVNFPWLIEKARRVEELREFGNAYERIVQECHVIADEAGALDGGHTIQARVKHLASKARKFERAVAMLKAADAELGAWNGHAGDCVARHDERYQCRCRHPELKAEIAALLAESEAGEGEADDGR